MKRLLAAAVCAGILASCFGGCGQPGQPAPGSAAPTDDSTGKYTEALKLSMVKVTNPSLDQRMSELKGITGETYDDNRWIRLFHDELNVDVSYQFIASGDNFTQKWRNSMATGQIPDVVAVNTVDLQQLYDADLIYDMTALFDQYASPLTKKIIDSAGTGVYAASKIDGKLMGIPQVNASLDSYRYLWLREDWMKKLGLEAPKTMDDLLVIMKAFVEKDPDGNGKKDTYAMMLDNALWTQLEGFAWCYGAYPDSWIEKDGKLVFGGIQPEMKQVLQFAQNLYKQGWLDPEFVVKDYSKAKEIIASGKAGVLGGPHFNASDILLPNKKNDANAEWGAYDWPSALGGPVKGELEAGLANVLVVSKQCANPEAAIKMLNLYYEKLYGESGDYDKWGNAEVDFVWQMGPFDTFDPNINLNAYREMQQVYQGKAEAGALKGVSKEYFENVSGAWDWQIMFGKGEHTAGYLMDTAAANPDRVFINPFSGGATKTMVEKGTELGQLASQAYTDIIMNKKDVDSGFDQFVSDWNKLGGEKITVEVNEWSQQNK